MMPTRRQAERALREAGFSRKEATEICNNGLAGFAALLSENEKIELGLAEPKTNKYIESILERASTFLN